LAALRPSGIRSTWDAAAAAELEHLTVGDPRTGRDELDGLFGRLRADPRGGTCVEIGCGRGRITRPLAERFDRVLALDVSPRMLEAARAEVGDAGNVEFRLVAGEHLRAVEGGVADVVVCYLVLQHLPRRRLARGLLGEIARLLSPGGLAFVQLPVLKDGLGPRAWRATRTLAVPAASLFSRDVTSRPAYRGVRLTDGELGRAVSRADLRVAARDESDTSPYRYAREVFLRLERA
jgi:2-polyprenyl-3-methyl-5-hydroxy-6-metoxy-1,4-benzoquinol methylase